MSEYFQDITPALRHVIGNHGDKLRKTRPINRAMKHFLINSVDLPCKDFRAFVIVDIEGWRRELSEIKCTQVSRSCLEHPLKYRKLRLTFESWKPSESCEILGLALYYIPHDCWIINPFTLNHNEVISMEPHCVLTSGYTMYGSSIDPDVVYQPWEDVVDNFGLEV